METQTKRYYFNMTTQRVTFEMRTRPCVQGTIEARQALVELFQMCVDNQNYLHCDAELLEKATIHHDGARWIFRSEAKVNKPPEA